MGAWGALSCLKLEFSNLYWWGFCAGGAVGLDRARSCGGVLHGQGAFGMWSDRKGQALVEVALVAGIAALLGFALIDLAWMFYVNLTMQHAVREGTRYAITGRSEPGKGRRASLIAKIREQSMGLYDSNLHNPKDPQISIVSPERIVFPNYTGTPTADGEDPGAANQIIIVSLTYTCPMLTPVLKPFIGGETYTFTVRSTMANESFTEGK